MVRDTMTIAKMRNDEHSFLIFELENVYKIDICLGYKMYMFSSNCYKKKFITSEKFVLQDFAKKTGEISDF